MHERTTTPHGSLLTASGRAASVTRRSRLYLGVWGVLPMKAAISLTRALVVHLSPVVPTVKAQTSCRFVLGSADPAMRLGPDVVGGCIKDQKTATGPDVMVFDSG